MINYGDIVLGQMYVWLGNETSIFEYTRNGTTPDSSLVTPLTLNYGDIFVALEVIHIEVSSETLFVLLDIKETTRIGVVKAYKILTANGDVGWISGLKEYFVELTP